MLDDGEHDRRPLHGERGRRPMDSVLGDGGAAKYLPPAASRSCCSRRSSSSSSDSSAFLDKGMLERMLELGRRDSLPMDPLDDDFADRVRLHCALLATEC